jgi:superfamily II DNA or RNA helicase
MMTADSELRHGLGSTAVVDPALNLSHADSYSILSSIQEDNPLIEIREEQVECLDAIQVARISGRDRALVQMATGLGKTMVVAADVKRFLADKPDARVLFLCHQNDILQQAQDSFSKIVGDQYSYGAFTGESKDYHEVTCLFASFQAMREWREAFLPDEFDYVVVDESHHAKAATYEPTLDYFKPDFMLGVTATPDRRDLRDIREIFGSEVYKLSLEEAIARDLVTPVDYHVITDDIADTRVLKDVRGRRYNYSQLDREIFIPKRTEEVIRIIKEKSANLTDQRRIIFCKSIEQANEYTSHFEGAYALHSRIPKTEQDQLIHHFKNGIIPTLLVVDMFNEGIDIPEANQIVFLRSTESRTIFLQQLGRGLRKYSGKDLVQVLDFVANCDRLVMLKEFWEGIEAETQAYASERKLDKQFIQIGALHFSESARDILAILDELESSTRLFQNWDAKDSITYYTNLYQELGHVPSPSDVSQVDGPSLKFLLRPFGGRIGNLRNACGLPESLLEKQPIPGRWKQWKAEDSIRIYRELSGEKSLTTTELLGALAIRDDVPSFIRFLQPFDGKVRNLRMAMGLHYDWSEWTADDSVALYKRLSGENPLTRDDLQNILEADKNLPSIQVVLGHFDKRIRDLQEAAGYRYVLPRWKNWTAEDSLKAYREVAGDKPIANKTLSKLLRERSDLPSLNKVLEPFGGKIRHLHQAVANTTILKDWSEWTADDTVRIYQELSGDAPLNGPELKEALRARSDLPAFSRFLKDFMGLGKLQEQAGYIRSRGDWSKWSANDSIRIYKDLSGEIPLDSLALRAILQARKDLPTRQAFLKPFEGSIKLLRNAAFVE